MRKVKSLLFLPYLAPYRINALNEIGKYYDLTVVFLLENTISIKYDQEDLRRKLQVNHVVLTSGFNFKHRQIRFGILKLIKQYKPEVIFSNEYGLTSLLIAFYKRINLVKFIHISTTSDNIAMAKSTHKIRRLARKFVLNSCQGLIVYNEEVKDWYQGHFKKLKVRICPNIQDPETLLIHRDVYKSLADQYIEKFELRGKTVYLFIGRFHPMKGLGQLIEIFNKVKKDNEVLILVGDGPLKQEIRRQINDLRLEKEVLLPGKFESEGLYAWYELASLFILPSNHEPFGAVINESLILGTPVLCSSVAGATYFIEEGKNGLIFNPKDREDFILKFKEARLIFKDFNRLGTSLMHVGFKSSLKTYYKIYCEVGEG